MSREMQVQDLVTWGSRSFAYRIVRIDDNGEARGREAGEVGYALYEELDDEEYPIYDDVNPDDPDDLVWCEVIDGIIVIIEPEPEPVAVRPDVLVGEYYTWGSRETVHEAIEVDDAAVTGIRHCYVGGAAFTTPSSGRPFRLPWDKANRFAWCDEDGNIIREWDEDAVPKVGNSECVEADDSQALDSCLRIAIANLNAARNIQVARGIWPRTVSSVEIDQAISTVNRWLEGVS